MKRVVYIMKGVVRVTAPYFDEVLLEAESEEPHQNIAIAFPCLYTAFFLECNRGNLQ